MEFVVHLMVAWPVARVGFFPCYIAFAVVVVAVVSAAINEIENQIFSDLFVYKLDLRGQKRTAFHRNFQYIFS